MTEHFDLERTMKVRTARAELPIVKTEISKLSAQINPLLERRKRLQERHRMLMDMIIELEAKP